MRILILNAIGVPRVTRRSTLNHTFALPRYAPQHQYVLHSYGDEVTAEVAAARFDVIVIDNTFLCYRWVTPVEIYDKLRETYAFVGRSGAIKIALPQDEYNYCEVLDEWLSDWRVDVIYSPSFDFRELFYRRCAGGDIRPILTGYVDDADIAYGRRFARPLADRRIDISYRARRLAPWVGRLGVLKANLGTEFARRAAAADLRIDVSNRDEDTLYGEAWLDFLGDSKFVLGSESGASLLDPRGLIRAATDAYVIAHPNASFEEVEATCFPGLDDQHRMTAISPRLFETIIAGACLVLVRGDYDGIVEAERHYIPLEPDFSNIGSVTERLRDHRNAELMAKRAYDDVIASSKYTYRLFVAEMLETCTARNARATFAAALPQESGSACGFAGDEEPPSLSPIPILQDQPSPLALEGNPVLFRDASFRAWLDSRYLRLKLAATMASSNAEIARLTSAIAEKARTIEALEAEIARLTEEAAPLNKEIARLIEVYPAEIARLNEEVARLNEVYPPEIVRLNDAYTRRNTELTEEIARLHEVYGAEIARLSAENARLMHLASASSRTERSLECGDG
jgi:cell division protein FtsB